MVIIWKSLTRVRTLPTRKASACNYLIEILWMQWCCAVKKNTINTVFYIIPITYNDNKYKTFGKCNNCIDTLD